MQHFSVIIIGGGPGGYETAIRLSQYNISCLVIEKARLGGICLNWGCIPTKALVKSAELFSEMKEAKDFGLPENTLNLDYRQVWERKNTVVEQLVSGVEYLFRKRKIPVVNAEATSVKRENGIYLVQTAQGESYGCDYLVLATGSEAKSLPGIEIDEVDVLSSTGILKLEELPETLAVVGGGVIGCEFASVFAAFGVKVTIIEFLPRIIALEEEEISKRLALSFKKSGITVKTGVGVQSIAKKEGGMELSLSDGSTLEAEKVLMSVGRMPVNTLAWEGLELLSERGAVVIDDAMRTNLDRVFAIGDLTAKLQLAHTASKQGLMVAEIIKNELQMAGDSYLRRNEEKENRNEEKENRNEDQGDPSTPRPLDLSTPRPLNYVNIPRCTFTHPEIASVGYTQAEAEKVFSNVRIGKFPFTANGKALAMGNTAGFVKTIARTDTNELVGMHIMGPNAAELIAQGAILIANHQTAEDAEHIVFAHPTLSEAIMEAMEDLRNLSIHTI